MSVLAAFSVALNGLLPAPHLHSDETRAIVHVHGTVPDGAHHADTDDDHHVVLDHGDHTAAQTLDYSYDLAKTFVYAITRVAAPTAADCATRASARLHRPDILPTHDPPLRFNSSPAPPAIV